MFRRLCRPALIYVLACAASISMLAQTRSGGDKIPITTSSDEARKLYLEGRDLLEKLRATDARHLFEQAVAKDPNFALAYVGLANTAGTNGEFVAATARATALADKVSEGERHLILALDSALKGDAAGNLKHLSDLVALFPNDERAHNQLGQLYFGRQEYTTAISHYVKATAINPSFSTAYNQLGYAYRFLEKYDDAETAFKKYVELIPNDPNPGSDQFYGSAVISSSTTDTEAAGKSQMVPSLIGFSTVCITSPLFKYDTSTVESSAISNTRPRRIVLPAT
jgi:tetratricopeptide (TPR) repeat protein